MALFSVILLTFEAMRVKIPHAPSHANRCHPHLIPPDAAAASISRATRAAVLGLLITVLIAIPAQLTAQSYTDNFEASSFNPFWTVTEQQGGTVSLCTGQNHTPGGKQSACFMEQAVVINKYLILQHQFSTPTQGDFSVWFYDSGEQYSDQTYYNYLLLSNPSAGTSVYVGNMDFDQTCYAAYLLTPSGETGQNANCGPYPQVSTTSVLRTVGWHLLTINVAANSVAVLIDGNQVFTAAGSYSFNVLTLNSQGPEATASATYFDDFAFLAPAASPTTTTLRSSTNPSTLGQNVTLTATVSPATATGTVTFQDGSTPIGTGTLSGGTATLVIGSLTSGLHLLTAVYNGDASDSPSTSPIVTQTVYPLPTTTTLTSSPNPSSFGQIVTLTATVSPSTATGSVTFKDASTPLGTGTLSNGIATLILSTLAVGGHSITAMYGGDADDVASTSAILTQNVVATCTYTVFPTSASAVAGTSTGSVTVTAPSGCAWPASSSTLSWVNITGATGSGTGTVTYAVQANPSSLPRTGSLTIAGQPFPLTQAGTACQITSLTPSSASLPSTAGSDSFGFALTPSDCPWAVAPTSSSSFVTTSSSGTGNGTINYSVIANPSSTARSGTIDITTTGTQAYFDINQAGTVVTCTYTLSPSSQSFSSSAGSGSVAITSQGVCPWTAASNATWVTITAGAAGSGSGTVSYTVANNPSTSPRTATLTIAGQTYIINQSGLSMPITCAASVPGGASQVALEGRTEVVGSLQLTCTGLTSPVTADIILTLNTNVTNAVTGTNTTDSLLTSGTTTQNGQVLTYTTLQWPGVVLTPNSAGSATLQISNARADASLLSAGSSNVAELAVITGQVSVSSFVPVTVTNANPTLATGVTTLSFLAGSTAPVAGGTVQQVSYQEAIPMAFHVASGGTPATRFRMVLSNVPTNVQLYAPLYPTGGSTQGQLYTADCSGSGGSAVTTGVTLAGQTYAQLTVTGGVASATWVVLSANPSAIDTLTLPMLVTGAGSASAWSNIQVLGSYAPVSPAGPACGSTDPSDSVVPRYRDFSVPLQFSYLQVTPSITISTSGALAISNTVTNMGSQPWSGSVNSAILAGTGATGTIQITCVATGNATCSSSNGQTTWNTSLLGQQTANYTASGQVQGAIPQAVTNIAGLFSGGAVATSPPPPPAPPAQGSTVLAPQIQIYTPSQSQTALGIVTVTGFAASGVQISFVKILLNGNPVGTATYGLSNDPNKYCSTSTFTNAPDCLNNGQIDFSYSLDTTQLAPGPYTLTAMAQDASGLQVFAPNTAYGSSNPIVLTVPGQVPPIVSSGTVTLGGAPLPGVTINVTGSQTASMTTNGAGFYSFSLPPTGTYTLSPFLLGYTFNPPNITITNPTTNQTANFTATPLPGLDYYSIAPCRVADTRVPIFPPGFGPPSFAAGETRPYPILSSPCAAGIPSNVAAYAVNFTVVPPAGGPAGNLTTWPVGLATMPNVSTLNYSASVVAGFAIVPAGINGVIDVYANYPTNILIDIMGYFAPPTASGLEFFTTTPCRIADTRVSTFPAGFGPPSLAGGETRVYPVPSSTCGPGIPLSVAAYSLNFTVVPPATEAGCQPDYLARGSASMPNVSTLNYSSTSWRMPPLCPPARPARSMCT